ncbi:hypothetical protein F8M41_023180 [Gigaspora margarita]|uniref:Zn(2)-C6 fungal-type domain-containing protein n=1 Tax=Gigaspora margarita TaxID=4874 RepID=A0A8H4ADV5_GIGMA|nr:hypothetical protein F8M41_023180 [Gigaspora margarita]
MSHLKRLQRSRNNTPLACTNCRKSHQRCVRLHEGICTYCKNYNLPCIYIPGRKRGPKTNFPPLPNINPCETAIKALFSSSNSSSFETPNPYNHSIISPNIHNGTTEAFQNTSIDRSSLPSFFPFVHEEVTQNNDPLIINPYPLSAHERLAQNYDPLAINSSQNATPSSIIYLNDSLSLETSDPYNNNIISPNIDNYGTNEAFQNAFIDQSFLHPSSPSDLSFLPSIFPFVHKELTQNNNPLIINPYKNIILPSTSHLEGSSSAQTPFNIHLHRVSEIFPNTPPSVHEGLVQNDDPLIISPSQNEIPTPIIYLNDSSSLETSDSYNNIISPNIDNYGTNEAFQNAFIDQSFLHPSSPSDLSFLPSIFPFVHKELTQNNNPLIINPYKNIILPSTSHLEGSSSAQTPFNIHLHRVSEIFPNTPPSVHEGLVQNDDPLIISPSQNAIPTSIIYLNDSSSLETSDSYNNIISPNIDNYGTNEAFQNAFIDQSFLHPSFPFIHEGSMQNYDHLTIDLFRDGKNAHFIIKCT